MENDKRCSGNNNNLLVAKCLCQDFQLNVALAVPIAYFSSTPENMLGGMIQRYNGVMKLTEQYGSKTKTKRRVGKDETWLLDG